MREAPFDVSTAQILAVVRLHWRPDVARLEHLPVGFGAHHWAAYVGRDPASPPALFVTLDPLLPRHSPGPQGSLESAYAGAAALADQGLEFVLAPLPSRGGTCTQPLGDKAVSVTPWRDGVPASAPTGAAGRDESVRRLARLHAAEPPLLLPRWSPPVPPDLVERLAALTASPWTAGPYGERARRAVRVRLDRVERWTADYHRWASHSDPATWVPTHGEPHGDNLLPTADGVLLVDWESLRLAPRERDLAADPACWPPDRPPDRRLLEMFDLEWRLDEINQYADWFAGPHSGTEDDRIAFDALLRELAREEPADSRQQA